MNIDKFIQSKGFYLLPIGGCREFGMNSTAIIYNSRLWLVDVGLMFPEPRQLGISAQIPKIDDFVKHFPDGVEAYLITHGHEDHIGALPYIYRQFPAPIYCSPWTAALITRKFAAQGISTKALKIVKIGQTIKTKDLKVQYIGVNHSIPDACSLFITCPDAAVFHTGDFKIDPQCSASAPIDRKLLQKIGDRGVDLLIADSTNAHSKGPSPSESSVVGPLTNHLQNAPGKVFITTFASHFGRLKTVAQVCAQLNKKLVIVGRGMQTTLEIAAELGRFNIPKNLLVEDRQAHHYPANKLVVLVSGSQAESRAALTRIVAGEHRFLKIQPDDRVVFSSRIIPGNERAIFGLCDALRQQGASIVSTRDDPAIHVSGHAYEGDLIQMLSLLRPKFYLPVHGTYSHLEANAMLSKLCNYTNKTTTVISNGDFLALRGGKISCKGQLPLEQLYVDSESSVPMSRETLQQRLRIGELGGVVLSGVYSRRHKRFIHGPDFALQGLEFPGSLATEVVLQKCQTQLQEQLKSWTKSRPFDAETLSEQGRLLVSQFMYLALRKKPVVISKFYVLG